MSSQFSIFNSQFSIHEQYFPDPAVIGILGGFSGTVGTVIGYRRNNQWFMRAKPRFVANPRTEAQQAHRRQFGDMVSLASKLLPALKVGMRHYAPQHAMTAGNAFVHLNWSPWSPSPR